MRENPYRIVPRNQESTYKASLLRPLHQIVAEMERKEAIKARKNRFEKRQANGIFWAHMFDMVLLGVPFLMVFSLSAQSLIPSEQFIYWRGIGALIATVALIRQQLRFSRFRCRECQTMLTSEYETGQHIAFRCEKCRIIWDSGFTHGSD